MTIRDRLKEIEAAIKYRIERIASGRVSILAHEAAIRGLQDEKALLFKDTGMMPFNLMTASEKAQILKMKLLEVPCDYCGKKEVRQGRKQKVCTNCGHDNT